MHNRFRTRGAVCVMSMMIAAILMTPACKKKEQQTARPPVPVTVGAVTRKAVPVQIRVIGNVEASSIVGVRAQIGGTLTKIHFTEGQDVQKGDLLFTIDPRPYEAALRQAEANLTRTEAQLENARAEEKRYAELVKKGYVSQTQYEQVRTNAAALEATAFADKALRDNARLNLSYCTIRSPFSGRTGSLMVYEGNLIKANADSPMVTINQVQPVNVSFAVPEKDLPEIKRYMAGGALKVEAFRAKDDRTPAEGRLTFIENIVDIETGTIKLKGAFDNRDRRLWPGQFVHVVLTLAMQNDAVVVPAQAVMPGQQGQYVFVVKQDMTADVRPVVISRTLEGESVVEKGLSAGEKVVTDGQVRLMPGAKVEIKTGGEKGEETGVKSEEKKMEGKGQETESRKK